MTRCIVLSLIFIAFFTRCKENPASNSKSNESQPTEADAQIQKVERISKSEDDTVKEVYTAKPLPQKALKESTKSEAVGNPAPVVATEVVKQMVPDSTIQIAKPVKPIVKDRIPPSIPQGN